MGEVVLIVLIIFLGILLLARVLNGPFGKDKGTHMPNWEWYRTDHEPDPDHNNQRGHWVDW
jgi:hypothetical protein